MHSVVLFNLQKISCWDQQTFVLIRNIDTEFWPISSWHINLINLKTSAFFQWPHTSHCYRIQPGCYTRTQNPSEVQWQRICQCKYLLLPKIESFLNPMVAWFLVDMQVVGWLFFKPIFNHLKKKGLLFKYNPDLFY